VENVGKRLYSEQQQEHSNHSMIFCVLFAGNRSDPVLTVSVSFYEILSEVAVISHDFGASDTPATVSSAVERFTCNVSERSLNDFPAFMCTDLIEIRLFESITAGSDGSEDPYAPENLIRSNKMRIQKIRITEYLAMSLLLLCMSQAFGVTCGDVNNSGSVDIVDALLIAQYYVGLNPSNFDTSVADVNADSTISIVDALRIAQFYVGLISQLSCSSETPVPTAAPTPGAGVKIIVPNSSWTCGMAGGIPKPEDGTLVFEANMQLAQIYNVGKTQYGQRQVVIVQGGTITSSKLNASVMSGGLDFQLALSNGVMEMEQLLVLKTGDGSYILLRNAGTGVDQNDVRMVPDFEAPSSGSYNWLNSGKYAGRRVIDSGAKTMRISVYDVSGVTVNPDSTNSVTITKPTDAPAQPWDYRTKSSSEKKGNQFITENVTLGGSQSVGTTKRGNRNIIPITGGTVTGNINGNILSAGADYQNLSNPMTIDAKYLWQTNDGEVIIIRNAGPMGSLVPIFEARADSKYAYVNNTLYLSSDPGTGSGGVQITFYESIK
jgi:hypothetical protein